MALDIKLDRPDRVYYPGELVTGAVVVTTPSSMKHGGIKLLAEGTVGLQLSARSIGLFEAFYSSLKPVQLMMYDIEVKPPGKIPAGTTEHPFQFTLNPVKDEQIYETYHGVYVNVHYMLTVDMPRSMLAKNLKKQKELVVQMKAGDDQEDLTHKPFHFKISPDSLQNVKESSKKKIPAFSFDGYLSHTFGGDVMKPLEGELTIRKCEVEIKSIELQLVRVECCTYMEGEAREATEIQNIQIADGNIVPNLAIPIHMVFPRLFTCSTTKAKQFKVEFEVNLIILFIDNHMITENFPIKLLRF